MLTQVHFCSGVMAQLAVTVMGCCSVRLSWKDHGLEHAVWAQWPTIASVAMEFLLDGPVILCTLLLSCRPALDSAAGYSVAASPMHLAQPVGLSEVK